MRHGLTPGKDARRRMFSRGGPNIWALLQRPRDWFAIGLRPATPLPGKCDYGTTIPTGIPGRDTARTPLPDTSQMRDFVGARLEEPRGGDIVVSAAHFGIPVGDGAGSAKAAHLRMVTEWVGGGGARICAGDCNWAAGDTEMDQIYTDAPQVSDV